MSDNKIAVVTGGSRGIGRAIVLRLVKDGYHVAFNFAKSEEAAKSLEQEAGGQAKGYCVDIKDFEAVKEWMAQVKDKFGAIHVLVNNAGIIIDKALMMMSQDDWGQVIDTNLNGMFNASRHCIVNFMKQKGGDIINISSVSGIFGLERQVNYSATKGGMNAFTKALAKEVAAYGVRVNAIAPGFIETEILSGFDEEQKKKIAKTIPLGHIGSVEDVANCVSFLLSAHAQYITGQILQVDGGLAIR